MNPRRPAGDLKMGYASRLFLALPALAVVGGCASLLGADFDRGGESADGGASDSFSGGDANAPAPSACGCPAPPANACTDAKVLRAWVPRGDCADPQCSYAHYDVLCATGCRDGMCTGNDPCNGVTCAEPPKAACADGDNLKTYSGSGTCSGGVCSYGSTSVACSQGCKAGGCTGDPCAGLSCSEPPPASCLNATTRRSYAAGTCSGSRGVPKSIN